MSRASASAGTQAPQPRPLAWPGSPEGLGAADVDFEAVAHVLANTCRWGGRSRQYLSLAQHAVAVSEEVEGLDGLGEGDRRTLALHAHSECGQPSQRIKPVQSTRCLHQELRQRIASPNVGQLVQQHGT